MQGFHDIILFAAVALRVLCSGKVLTAYGWDMLSGRRLAGDCFAACVLISLFIAEKRRPAERNPANAIFRAGYAAANIPDKRGFCRLVAA